MGAFINIIILLFATNILLSLFGVITPSDSLISSLVTGDIGTMTIFDYIKENLDPTKASVYGLIGIFAVAASFVTGLITKRDELIYGPLLIGLLVFLGVFNVFKSIPLFGNVLYVGMILLTTWFGLEWLRGKD
ncbi:MAG: hypothetical protein NC935_02140 [Candidatus Omnitrophica bacterium]|nr:hypothetical protein [Candidatus Omnitrophota bacterium]